MSALARGPVEPHPAPPLDSGARPGVSPERGLALCPLLRSGDGSWSSVYASRDLQCWAVRPPAQLTLMKQRQLCVTAGHTTCATYQAAAVADPVVPVPEDGLSLLWPAATPVVIALESVHGRGVAVSPPRAGGQAVLVALMLVAFVVLAIAKTGGSLGGSSTPGTPAPTVSAAASAVVAASATATPTPLPSVEATPSARPSASAPPPSPTPSPSASPRTYKVRSGDTLAAIAAKFHSTVKAIVAANNITDPRTIHPGQVLVIP